MTPCKILEKHATLILLTLAVLVLNGPVLLAQDRAEMVTIRKAASTESSSPAVGLAENRPRAASVADVLIGEGDLLQVTLYGVPDFNEQVRVSSTGEITLPMIGQVEVRSLSPIAAANLISKRLKDGGFFNNPQVTVLEREFATQGISVLGEVQKPGVYPILGPRKLFDLISAAGGTTPKAGRDITISSRENPEKVQTVSLSDDVQKSMEANVDIYPGDTILVSKAGLVYVVGDVRLPGGFIIDKDKDLTVLQAVALAQGVTSYADLNRSKVIRKTSNGIQETPILLKKIFGGKASDPTLQADDILFIPHNGTKEAARKGLDTILQTAAGVAIYRF
jgi:polysaccharide export outer membrane protein